jgi:hypothetical protein
MRLKKRSRQTDRVTAGFASNTRIMPGRKTGRDLLIRTFIASMQPWLFHGENGTASDDFKKIFDLRIPVAVRL